MNDLAEHYGYAFPADDRLMSSEMTPSGDYQRAHLDAALNYVIDWRLAIDGGAHVGLWALRMAPAFDEVIAVEPCPDTAKALKWNLARHGGSNVIIKQVALGAEPGLVRLERDARNEARANSGAWFVQTGGPIKRETIDSWQVSSCGFLKLDVEGSEPLALEGARETIARCRPIVLFENKGFWVSRYGMDLTAPQKILLSLGYRQLRVVGLDCIWGSA